MHEPIRILLIDDDKVTNLIHTAIIKRLDYPADVTCCLNAEEAIEFLGKVEKWPHYIFLDLNMPVLDGWGFLDKMEGKQIDSTLYILSSSIDPSDIERSKKYTLAKGFISKPLTLEKLKEALVPVPSSNS